MGGGNTGEYIHPKNGKTPLFHYLILITDIIVGRAIGASVYNGEFGIWKKISENLKKKDKNSIIEKNGEEEKLPIKLHP